MDQEHMQRTQPSSTIEVATLGGGCFWCLDAVFLELNGIKRVESGYAGGSVPNPSYEAVCAGTTGHAEVAQITFDSQVITFKESCRFFLPSTTRRR